MGYRCDTLRRRLCSEFNHLEDAGVIVCAKTVILCARFACKPLIHKEFRAPLIVLSYRDPVKTVRICGNRGNLNALNNIRCG